MLAVGVTLTQAGPAAAHVNVTSVSPTDGAELATAPSMVLLTFSEVVEAVHDGTQVLDESRSPMAVGAPRHPSGHPERVEGHHRVVAIVVDVAHLGAAALWLGGLLMLLVGPLSARASSARGGTAFLRYSRLAATFVLLLVATGVVAGARRTGSLGALTQTSYGGVLDPGPALSSVPVLSISH